jgi:hypothetical protein
MINELFIREPKDFWDKYEAPCLLYVLKVVRTRWGGKLDSPVWKVGITQQSIKNRFDRFSGKARLIEQSEQFDDFAFAVMESVELAAHWERNLKQAFVGERFYKDGHDPHNLQLLDSGNSELFTADPVEWFAIRRCTLSWHKRFKSESEIERKEADYFMYYLRKKTAEPAKPVLIAPRVKVPTHKLGAGASRWADDPSRDMPSGGTTGDCHLLGKTNWDKSKHRSYGQIKNAR